jgi:hypothetical protein
MVRAWDLSRMAMVNQWQPTNSGEFTKNHKYLTAARNSLLDIV